MVCNPKSKGAGLEYIAECVTASGDVYSFWINLCYIYNIFSFIGYNGDTIGIFLKKENYNLIDKSYKDYDFNYFNSKREKYIKHVPYEEILKRCSK